MAVVLPPAQHLDEGTLLATVRDTALPIGRRSLAAGGLVFLHRCRAEIRTNLGCLRLGPARFVSMPGELFVEYQRVAQKMRPEAAVMMAAYGDYGPGYIGTGVAYTEGGYETGPVSRVAPGVEEVLVKALRDLLR